MPIYEYHCTKCDRSFEKLVFTGEEHEVRCPHCASQEVNKEMSATSFMGKSIGTCAADAPKGFS